MILIPELKTVLILVPKTGSSSLKNAVLSKYPESMLIYRHMEACGIPQGYDMWDKVGIVRHPLERLWSLYKYLMNFGGDYDPAYIERMNCSVNNIDFSQWILKNQTVFSSPYGGKHGEFHTKYTVRHSLPENRKSQYLYLRPDLGTKIYKFNQIEDLAKKLDVKLDRVNETPKTIMPVLSNEAREHMKNIFSWDYEVCPTY